jgi:glycosyltransferase involved in cell wall biosynthesis
MGVSNSSITFFVPSLNSGGVEKVFINLMNELVSLNFKVTLILCHKEGILFPLLDERVTIVSFNRQIRKSLIPLIKYLNLSKIKVLISGPHYANVIAILASILSSNKCKTIVTHHNFHDEETKLLGLHGRLAPWILHFFYSRAFKVIAVSNSLKKHIVEDLRIDSSKIEVIYNPVVNKKVFELADKTVSHKFFFPERDFDIIIAIGRLSPVKNLSLLIESLYEVKKQKKVKLVIIGEGPEDVKLKTLVIKKELQDDVDFVSFTENPYNYLSNSDLLVLPSNSESFSLVIVEALALGITVVSTDTEGPMEILEEGKYGYIVEKNNISQMTEKIIYALKNPFSKVLISSRGNDYRTDIIVQKYIDLFENIN